MEIERKFLVRAIPGGHIQRVNIHQQGYYSLDPEVRFRKRQTVNSLSLEPIAKPQFFGTIKSVGTRVRDEVEGPISEEFYKHMEEVIEKPFITKLQYLLEYKGREISVAIVDRDLPTSFIYAETEFESEEEMDHFVWPWPNLLIKDVTDDPEFYMQNYWKRTRLT